MSFNKLFVHTNVEGDEKLYNVIKSDFRPNDIEDLTSLPHFLILYCYYRCLLLFKGTQELCDVVLKLIKKMINENVERRQLTPLLKNKFIILVWAIASAKVSGICIFPGPSQGI